MKNKPEKIYLLLVLGVCLGLGIAALFTQNSDGNPIFNLLQKGFTLVPVLAALLTRAITHDASSLHTSLTVWKRPGLWAFCALVPGVLISLGAVLYFAVFPQEYAGVLDYGALLKLFGMSQEGQMAINSPVLFWLVAVLVSAVFIPIQLLELGEEIGWRGYLLPKQIKRYGVRRAVLYNGLLWGVAHMPLIYFGFNYSTANIGAPWSNMLVMMLVCMVTGVICSYVTIVSGNCMYAAIVHGVINVIGEMPVFLSLTQQSGLLGPNPTGLIGIAGLLICAVVLFLRLDRAPDRLTADQA